ncbi:MAG: GTPase Era [Acidobacteriota bacterium]
MSDEQPTTNAPTAASAEAPAAAPANPVDDGPRCGSIALIGRPNAGKSTLMNHLLAEKLAIVSRRPQTTRNRIVGILSEARGQVIVLDTPGVHKPQHRMNKRMLKAAHDALADADVVCLLHDAEQPFGGGDRYMVEWLAEVAQPRIALLNKIDRIADKRALLPRIATYAEAGFDEILPVSARTGAGCDTLLDLVFARLPVAPPRYDPELITIHPERFLVAERIREKLLERLRDELPFATAVVLEHWQQKGPNLIVLHASILVERPSQKRIVVGKQGSMIRALGTAAREDLEAYLESKVFLELNVRVQTDWREDPRVLDALERAPSDVSNLLDGG